MKCPKCESDQLRKNGRPNGRQRYLCKACRKQFFEPPDPQSLIRQFTESELSAAIPQEITSVSTTDSGGIAILLLDAENLKLNVNTEQFLASLCDYPLQVKVAFANWKNPSTGKLDAELYDRGYELIHVPGGSNSADGKMIAFGAAILYRYRDVKQVFVCSSDGLLNHLCNQLQNQGLTVFRVRRKNAVLSVENCQTGDTNHYSCEREMEIPSFEELANQITELLKAEHKSIDERIARFSSVAELFKERHNVDFNSTPSYAAALWESAQKEVTPVSEVSLATVVVHQNVAKQQDVEIVPVVNSHTIDSLDVFQIKILEIIESAKNELHEDTVSLVRIQKEFLDKYKSNADVIVKRFLGKNSSFLKYLQSQSTVFQVNSSGQKHQVAIVAQKSAASKAHDYAALEASVAKIIRGLTAESPGSYVPINQVASEFNKLYNQPLTKKLQSLNLGSKVINFLQSCKAFKVQKKGKDDQVAIALS
ncbi:MAG TPA: Insertion element protein [Microcoleaceae bacterium UBA10368]|jgi:Transposase and inactivated derivatives|nr:Insertion element protein [Microcoleaceae cyanobacterium UBA10368]HCV29066.1 Insertion element protein [Microcoleaceae cyanobacterium UBA9251]